MYAKAVFRLIMFALVLLTIAISGVVIGLCRQQALVLVYPPRTAAQVTPADYDIADWREVELTTADGLRLVGWYIPPRNGAALIFLHGHSNNRSHLLPEMARLHTDGYGGLLIDLRNHGESEGNFTSMGWYETADAEAAFAFLKAQPEVDPERIGIYGASMGGAAAARAAARIPQIKLVVIDATYASLSGTINHTIEKGISLPGFPFTDIVMFFINQETGAQLYDLRPADAIASMGEKAFLLIHGTSDSVISVEQANLIYEQATGPNRLVIIEGGLHGGLMQHDPDAYADQVFPFIREHL